MKKYLVFTLMTLCPAIYASQEKTTHSISLSPEQVDFLNKLTTLHSSVSKAAEITIKHKNNTHKKQENKQESTTSLTHPDNKAQLSTQTDSKKKAEKKKRAAKQRKKKQQNLKKAAQNAASTPASTHTPKSKQRPVSPPTAPLSQSMPITSSTITIASNAVAISTVSSSTSSATMSPEERAVLEKEYEAAMAKRKKLLRTWSIANKALDKATGNDLQKAYNQATSAVREHDKLLQTLRKALEGKSPKATK